jgi:lysophospholipid acyltransferase (LPLAT)-like uncharacterized protein
MTLKRRIIYTLLTPILKLIIFVIWRTCRVVSISGEENAQTVTQSDGPFIPCYWHGHHFYCSWYMKKLIRQGLKIGFLVSPSVDGEIPAKLARSWGAEVIRGSTTRTGAQAMRDMYNLVVKQGVSPVTTSDGPQGPVHVFKVGDIMLSQFTQAPLLPLAYAADRAWTLKSWDRFMIPKPFSRIAIAIGEPVTIPRGLLAEDLEPYRLQMENALKGLTQLAENNLN